MRRFCPTVATSTPSKAGHDRQDVTAGAPPCGCLRHVHAERLEDWEADREQFETDTAALSAALDAAAAHYGSRW